MGMGNFINTKELKAQPGPGQYKLKSTLVNTAFSIAGRHDSGISLNFTI
jgi:hypothetical protein